MLTVIFVVMATSLIMLTTIYLCMCLVEKILMKLEEHSMKHRR
jgi:predicted DNA repair protein MutK